MRILHTSDWHLSDRLYWVDRQPDIRQRLRELAAYLDQYQVDVMVIAGDLFSQRNSRMEELQAAIQDVNATFTPFLRRGGSIVAISGNHDSEALFGLLRAAQDLSAPMELDDSRDLYPGGRMYLVSKPTLLPLADGNGQRVQFVLLPYPTEYRYLPADVTYKNLEEKHLLLRNALITRLRQLCTHRLSPQLPSVLVAHLHVRGSELHTLYKLHEQDDVVFDLGDLPAHWAYAAFGHIHKGQIISDDPSRRYSGSIERMDVMERNDAKGAVLVEIKDGMRIGTPRVLPLHATPIYRFDITDPETEVPRLAQRFPDGKSALAYYTVCYRPGVHDINKVISDIDACFRATCKREVIPQGSQTRAPATVSLDPQQSVPEKVRAYLNKSLEGDADREALLALLEQLLAEGVHA